MVDLGIDEDVAPVNVIHRGKFKSLTQEEKCWLKCRQAIVPMIGHTKSDNRMDRCWLKRSTGDALHALGCAAGYCASWYQAGFLRLLFVALICPCCGGEMRIVRTRIPVPHQQAYPPNAVAGTQAM